MGQVSSVNLQWFNLWCEIRVLVIVFFFRKCNIVSGWCCLTRSRQGLWTVEQECGMAQFRALTSNKSVSVEEIYLKHGNRQSGLSKLEVPVCWYVKWHHSAAKPVKLARLTALQGNLTIDL